MSLSRAQRHDIIRLYGIDKDKAPVTGAGYNDRLFYAVPKPAPEPVQLVYVGKLSDAKGVPWFLRSLGAIQSPPWLLHLVGSGSGEERERCLRLAGGLGGKVRVHGALTQAGAAEIIRQSHIMVLPSFFEGLPLVILEGLACGCRIVATDLPGTRELLGDVGADFISLVKTPRLRYIDQPYREDEQLFEQSLQGKLQHQIGLAESRPNLDLTPIQERINAYTWAGVFKNVKSVYLNCLG
jgi:glycosyltransferase involved in cell wall biosynthesis